MIPYHCALFCSLKPNHEVYLASRKGLQQGVWSQDRHAGSNSRAENHISLLVTSLYIKGATGMFYAGVGIVKILVYFFPS